MSETQQTPEEIRAQIEETRRELGDTVNALSDRADVKEQARRKKEEARRRVSANPTPLAGIAVFIGLLILLRILKRR